MPRKIFFQITLLFYCTLILGQIRKQPNIQFETDYLNAVDRWVVLPQKTREQNYLLGYIYLDEIVGFTFTFYSELSFDSLLNWKLQSNTQYYITNRTLDRKTPPVYILTDEQIAVLHLPEKPIWLKLADERQKTPEDLVLLGYQYNKVQRSDLALSILESAYLVKPKAKNLIFELSFAYNSLGRYEKAIDLLKTEIKQDSENHMLYRELGYSLLQLNEFEEAEKVYELGIKMCPNTNQQREMAIDMALTFFAAKDEKRFEKWAAILRK
jgi:tetratricopeptide (TPR) repeat protein